VKLAHFTATVDWGDGLRAPGVIRQTGPGGFSVFGSHRYLDPMRYSVAVHVHRASPAADAVAWTSIKMGGFVGPPQLPPFAKASITSFWSDDPIKFYRTGGTDILGRCSSSTAATSRRGNGNCGCGFRATRRSTPRAPTRIGNSAWAAQQPFSEIALNALPPGAGGNFGFVNAGAGADFTIRLPAGETGAGKYVIAQLVYNDPITDNMPVRKAIPFGPLNGIVVSSPQFISGPVLSVKEGAAGATETKAVFRVKLDTLPTSDVKIPLEIVNGNGTVDTSRATLDKAQLIFTSAFGTTEQTVVVTAKDDMIKNGSANFLIRLKAAESTDLRFNGMDGQDISLQVLDNDP
jgi:hypothetical protein